MNILERYIAHKAVRCPYCESDDIESNDLDPVDGSLEVRAEVKCCNCDAHWTDVYKLTSIEVTKGPKRDTQEDFTKLGYVFKIGPTVYGGQEYECTYRGRLVCSGHLAAQEGEKTYRLIRRCRFTMLAAAVSDFYRRFIELSFLTTTSNS